MDGKRVQMMQRRRWDIRASDNKQLFNIVIVTLACPRLALVRNNFLQRHSDGHSEPFENVSFILKESQLARPVAPFRLV
jgi:hypothetical protein